MPIDVTVKNRNDERVAAGTAMVEFPVRFDLPARFASHFKAEQSG
jgi:hypothetical protein